MRRQRPHRSEIIAQVAHSARAFGVILAATSTLAACSPDRAEPVPTFREDIAPLFAAKCTKCHDGATAAAGYRTTSYLSVVGCVAGVAATAESGPLLRALAGTHAGYVTADERSLIERWVGGGAPASRGGVHPVGFVDPRSPDSHATFLRSKRWTPMLDGKDSEACGRCHDGAPNRAAFTTDLPAEKRVTSAAPNATACTTCHTEPEGPLACGTCHGNGPRAAPPRDACFFPRPTSDAHRAHVEPSNAKKSGLACNTCHPVPSKVGDFSATHGDGAVQVQFNGLGGPGSKFDTSSKQCSVRCHKGQGGSRPSPAWTETEKMTCQSCHSSPPPAHYKSACTNCHTEPDGTGAALAKTDLHLNGTVDVGNGNPGCGACHGKGDDPFPTTGPHPAHAAPKSSKPVECTTCHVVPTSRVGHPSGKAAATVTFAGLATWRGLSPTYDATTKTCSNVYCHAGAGGALTAPTWVAGTVVCGSCHSIPPPPSHTTSTGCGVGFCHNGAISGGVITTKGAAHHVDGQIDLNIP
ncbi:MAG: CxxxxCH/CxxCH domain-containing protein [Myxococcales bacterium]|nr:CxxxxCH/CxxCH domain-containing protein [Myxococcales bacterium]